MIQIQVLPGLERVQGQPRQVIEVLSQIKGSRRASLLVCESLAPGRWKED